LPFAYRIKSIVDQIENDAANVLRNDIYFSNSCLVGRQGRIKFRFNLA
jgi:hypothetical protein